MGAVTRPADFLHQGQINGGEDVAHHGLAGGGSGAAVGKVGGPKLGQGHEVQGPQLVVPRGRAVGHMDVEGRVQGQAGPLQGAQVPEDQGPAYLVNPGVNQGLDDDLGPHPHGVAHGQGQNGSKGRCGHLLLPWRRQALHLNVDLIPPEGDLEVVIKEVGGVGAVEGRPGPGSDGIRDAFPVAGKIAVDMTGKDMGHVIFMKEGGQPAPGGLRQAMVIVTPPGVKKGSMEKHQAGLVRLGFFQFAFQPAPLDLADPARPPRH